MLIEDACFTISLVQQDWNTAEQACIQDGGSLAPINSPQVQNVIEAEMERLGISQLWIAAREEVSTDPLPWKWIEGNIPNTGINFYTLRILKRSPKIN